MQRTEKNKKKLRSGYTTGACAAAAAKAAATLLIRAIERQSDKAAARISEFPNLRTIEIPFPDGSRHLFRIQKSEYRSQNKTAFASVIKDAGDDPDVTNGAKISAAIRQCDSATGLIIRGGKGVGIVTKPGLAIPVGEPAINPVPRKMIIEAVMEAINSSTEFKNLTAALPHGLNSLEITISVPDGEKLAKKTLNHRLGIVGGISILGTTGIVKPISSEAWTATITSSMNVAKAMGYDEIVLSAGRASEKAHINKYNLPEECYVMMGDYLEFALLEAKRHGFKKIHLCAQWAKMLKIAMATPQTHVRHGAIDVKKAVEFFKGLGAGDWGLVKDFNTAREIFELINSTTSNPQSVFKPVCSAAKKYAWDITAGIPVIAHLVSYGGGIIASSE